MHDDAACPSWRIFVGSSDATEVGVIDRFLEIYMRDRTPAVAVLSFCDVIRVALKIRWDYPSWID